MSAESNNTPERDDEQTLEELCHDIANDDDLSEKMQDVAAEIRDGIRRGDIDVK